MSEEEKKKMIERLAEKFVKLGEPDKDFVTGYMVGKEEERGKWQKKLKTA